MTNGGGEFKRLIGRLTALWSAATGMRRGLEENLQSHFDGSDTDMHADGSQTSSDSPLTLTPTAIEHVKLAMKREGASNHGLRVAVRSGGCSGMEYHLGFEDAPNAGDTVYQVDGVAIYVDQTSQEYLAGVTIDYVSGLHGAGFKFLNPNAARTCGCGSSFST